MEKMITNVCVFFVVNVFFLTITHAIPRYRYRRQLHTNINDGLPYAGWGGGGSNPSGSIPGAYYGTGNDPNYGHFGSNQNSAFSSGISVGNYDQDSIYNGGSNQNSNQQPSYLNHNNNNNAWQRPSSNYYYNQLNNRYPVGSQGWYATGSNYGYNKGRSLMPHAWLLIISIVMLIIYT